MPRGQADQALIDEFVSSLAKACTNLVASRPRAPVLLALVVMGRIGARDVRDARRRSSDAEEAKRRSDELDEAWDEACAIAHACRAETQALMADDVTLGRSICRRPLDD